MLTRRDFARRTALAAAGLAFRPSQEQASGPAVPLALARNPDQTEALQSVFDAMGDLGIRGRAIHLKGNFNSPDPYPATTHPDALIATVRLLRDRGCGKITLIERSGMGRTKEIWDALGITGLARRHGFELLALEDLAPRDWRKAPLPDSHWKGGVLIPGFLNSDNVLIQISNLKTHRFGGVFSASLKNSIGLIAKYGPPEANYNYMAELHGSPHQCDMIAEVNTLYEPRLVLLDAAAVFITEGPEKGDISNPQTVVASADRVAVDAVGVALLRLHGARLPLRGAGVFEQPQLKRAVELNLGVKSAKEIRFLAADGLSRALASQLGAILSEVPDEKEKA